MKKPLPKRLEYILGKLQAYGPITARAMFGGYGIYAGRTIFASFIEGKLYFRVNESNEQDYESYDSEPFVYMGLKRPVVMPYRTLPDEILEDKKKLLQWIEKAKKASLAHKRKKR